MKKEYKKKIEVAVERFLWDSRIITFFAVAFSLLSALVLFLAGSLQIVLGCWGFAKSIFVAGVPKYKYLIIEIVSAVDLYLIGLVLLIFSFGLYELFISKIDPAKEDKEINILEIRSLDDLKNNLLKVIIMVLIVFFFKTILQGNFQTPLEMIYLGASILLVSTSTFFIRNLRK